MSKEMARYVRPTCELPEGEGGICSPSSKHRDWYIIHTSRSLNQLQEEWKVTGRKNEKS